MRIRLKRVRPNRNTLACVLLVFASSKSSRGRNAALVVALSLLSLNKVHLKCFGADAIPIGTHKQLCIDERFVEQKRGVELVMNAPHQTGELLVKFGGRRLELNVDTSAGGSVRVELLAEDGSPIPQFQRRGFFMASRQLRAFARDMAHRRFEAACWQIGSSAFSYARCQTIRFSIPRLMRWMRYRSCMMAELE